MSSMIVAPVVVSPLMPSKKHEVKERRDGSSTSGSPMLLQIQYGSAAYRAPTTQVMGTRKTASRRPSRRSTARVV